MPDSRLRGILSQIEPNTIEFIGNLNHFFIHRREIREVYDKADPWSELSDLEVDVVSIKTDEEGQYKAEFLQQRIGGGSVRGIDDLYDAAGEAHLCFNTFVGEIAAKVGSGVKPKLPPGLKGRPRAAEKAADDYGDRIPGPGVGWLYDIVRGTLMCATVADIKQVLMLVKTDPRVKVALKAKNRFKHPTPNGFCDFLLQLQMVFELSKGKRVVHICELQIHLTPVSEYAVSHNSHRSYEYFRTYFAGSMETVAERLRDLESIVGGDFETNDMDADPRDVLADVVASVLSSKDVSRLNALFNLFSDYLLEFDLAIYVGEIMVNLEIQALGPDHSSVGQTYNNMASVLESQGKLGEAMTMYEKALAIKVKALGPDHSSVGDTCYNMALLAEGQGNVENALKLFRRSVSCYTTTYGPDHQETIDAKGQVIRLEAVIWR